jgi:hypothetical protein
MIIYCVFVAELNERHSGDLVPNIAPLFETANANTDEEYNLPTLPSIVLPTATEVPPSVSLAGLRKEYHPNRSAYALGTGGQNLLQRMDNDEYSGVRHESGNFYYPFASEDEWRLAHWLTCSPLPQSEVNTFLHLNWVSTLYQRLY